MISIIGAGPAGNYLAYLLAKAGKKVHVFEEHPEIGKPVQCTGIVTAAIRDIIDIPDDCVINTVKKARIYAPNNTYVETRFSRENLILDRNVFDNFLADKAIQAGATYLLNNSYVCHDKTSITVRYKKEKDVTIPTDIIIGADGPNSKVGRMAGLVLKRKYWTGVQVRARFTNKNIVDFYPFIGTFAWVVPESRTIARIGILGKENIKKEFDRFLTRLQIQKKDIIEKQGGIIPQYDKHIKTSKGNVYLVGDAAGFVKGTTAGGIIQALLGAEALSNSLINNLSYHKEWKKRIGKDLYVHLLARKILDNFSKKDYDLLVKLCNQKKVRTILETRDRDYLSQMIVRLVLSEPRLLYFIKNLI